MTYHHYYSFAGLFAVSLFLTLLLNTEAFGKECASPTIEQEKFIESNQHADVLFTFKKDESIFKSVIAVMQEATKSEFDLNVDKIVFYDLQTGGKSFSLHIDNCVIAWGMIVDEFFEEMFGKEI